MSYVSGRTVKSAKPAKPTNTASATRDARRLVERHIPGVGATVTSTPFWDLASDRHAVRTVITFPQTADADGLADAVEDLSGVIRSDRTGVAVTIIRAA